MLISAHGDEHVHRGAIHQALSERRLNESPQFQELKKLVSSKSKQVRTQPWTRKLTLTTTHFLPIQKNEQMKHTYQLMPTQHAPGRVRSFNGTFASICTDTWHVVNEIFEIYVRPIHCSPHGAIAVLRIPVSFRNVRM